MQHLHVVGFTSERDGLIFSARRGSRSGGFVVSVDERLLDSIREIVRLQAGDAEDVDLDDLGGTHPRRRTLKVHSNLSPRDIQARLRAGRTVGDVAAEAGVDEDWVRRFASPVLAEQSRVLSRALGLVCRANRKGLSALPLGDSVALNVADRGTPMTRDQFDAGWSTYHVHEASWMVRFRYRSRRGEQVAQWGLDLGDASLVPLNRLGTELGYVDPGRRRRKLTFAEALATEERLNPPIDAGAADGGTATRPAPADDWLDDAEDSGDAIPAPPRPVGNGRRRPSKTSAARGRAPPRNAAAGRAATTRRRPAARAAGTASTRAAKASTAGGGARKTAGARVGARKALGARKGGGARKAVARKAVARKAVRKDAATRKAAGRPSTADGGSRASTGRVPRAAAARTVSARAASARTATAARKATPARKAAAGKATVIRKVASTRKGSAPRKVASPRKAATAGKAASLRKAATTRKAATARKAATTRKGASAGKAASLRKAVTARKVASARKTGGTGASRAGQRAVKAAGARPATTTPRRRSASSSAPSLAPATAPRRPATGRRPGAGRATPPGVTSRRATAPRRQARSVSGNGAGEAAGTANRSLRRRSAVSVVPAPNVPAPNGAGEPRRAPGDARRAVAVEEPRRRPLVAADSRRQRPLVAARRPRPLTPLRDEPADALYAPPPAVPADSAPDAAPAGSAPADLDTVPEVRQSRPLVIQAEQAGRASHRP